MAANPDLIPKPGATRVDPKDLPTEDGVAVLKPTLRLPLKLDDGSAGGEPL